MHTFLEYLNGIWPLSPLFLFIISVSFRLLDNSAYLFLQKEIIITSSNVSRSVLKQQIRKQRDPEFTRQLRKALLYRNLHKSFMICTLLSIPFSLIYLILG